MVVDNLIFILVNHQSHSNSIFIALLYFIIFSKVYTRIEVLH